LQYFTAAALIWNQQCLLTPVRYVINPRFQLTSPLLSGLFFLAPGAGYIVGTLIGGRWADRTVSKWIERQGERIPEDRLRSTLVSTGVLIPGSILIYGWTIQKQVGGIPLPVICMFLQGVGQMVCFPSLNTYCLDVMQTRSAEVICMLPSFPTHHGI
jgi:MFS family permease